MCKVRTYGSPPFLIAVLHGGPGAPGEVAPVARELSQNCGVLEPLSMEDSLEEQIQELHSVIKDPIALIGFSWGAMLAFIFSAGFPEMVTKLILVSSGVFEEKYAKQIMQTRLNRLSKEKRAEVECLISALEGPKSKNKDKNFRQLGQLLAEADSFDPIPHPDELPISCLPKCVARGYRFKEEWQTPGNGQADQMPCSSHSW
jgi:pimeloyl-ACP methyl ester carboxylesterase